MGFWCNFIAGSLAGIYIAQNYEIPNLRHAVSRIIKEIKEKEIKEREKSTNERERSDRDWRDR